MSRGILEFNLFFAMNEMLNPTPETLSPLCSVLGFDVIEFWSPDDQNSLQCVHFYLDESVKQVIKRIFPQESKFTPAVSPSWRENSLKVYFSRYISNIVLILLRTVMSRVEICSRGLFVGDG